MKSFFFSFVLCLITYIGFCIDFEFNFDGEYYSYYNTSSVYFVPRENTNFLCCAYDNVSLDGCRNLDGYGSIIRARKTLSGNVILPTVSGLGYCGYHNAYFRRILDGAMSYCTNIVSLTIPNGYETIGYNAFYGCCKLESVILGKNVTTIAKTAFDGTAITNLFFYGIPPYGLADTGVFDSVRYIGFDLSLTNKWEAWCLNNSHVLARAEEMKGGGETRLTLAYPVYGAKIRYTCDGSMPSGESPLYTSNISLTGNTIVKALAFLNGRQYSKLLDFEFRPENIVSNLTISSTLGDEFDMSGNVIRLHCATKDAVIHYTLDGSEVTETSAIFGDHITIGDSAILRARGFKAGMYNSDELKLVFVRVWYTNATPVVSAESESFSGISQEVALSCETEGATIYYTLDGSIPSKMKCREYKNPFNIYQTTTVRAIAVKDDWKDSAVVTATFTRTSELGPAVNLLDALPDNDKSYPWTVVTDTTHDGNSAVKSGNISDDEMTSFKVTRYGAGRLSFWWKTSCEPIVDGEMYDYATFYNGSTVVTNLAGVTDWEYVSLDVPGTGKHVFKWTYQKDGAGSEEPDGLWLDQVQWIPATTDYYSDSTLTTETPVPYAWLDKYGYGRDSDFETAAKALSGKCDEVGYSTTVEDEYIIGTDPTNMTSRLLTEIEVVDGVSIVKWNPDLNEDGTKALRTYKVWGSTNLLDSASWHYPTNSLDRFFKVTVEMP